MASKRDSDKPARKLKFRGAGEHDAPKVKTGSKTYKPEGADEIQKVTYTISYAQQDVSPKASPADIARSLSDTAVKEIEKQLSSASKDK